MEDKQTQSDDYVIDSGEIEFGEISDSIESMFSGNEPREVDYNEISTEAKENSDDLLARWGRENKRIKLLAVLKAWKDAQLHESRMKTWVAIVVFSLLTIEMLLVGLAFFFIGFGLIKVELWVAETFILGIIVQIFGIATIVVKGLFPAREKNSLSELTEVVKDI